MVGIGLAFALAEPYLPVFGSVYTDDVAKVIHDPVLDDRLILSRECRSASRNCVAVLSVVRCV